MRPYLGPTSLKHELAFLMINQAQVKAGDCVFEPFVGTGSIAIAATHHGAQVFASEIDIRVLTGTGIGHKIEKKKIV